MPNEVLLQQHSSELMILALTVFMLGSLLIVVPQLLRAHQRTVELAHTEHMRALEQGLPVPRLDERSLFAGRTALLVPMVSICSAATVTCFLVAYRAELVFSVSLAIWSVAGVVSLAAITGGVALLGRLAQLQSGGDEEEDDIVTNPLEEIRKQL
jgi:hypothetical protein